MQVAEAIGPWQVENGTLWFARTFYDSEGASGMGGFGYFDTADRTFHVIAPHTMLGYSATAMLAKPDAIWLALATREEYGTDAEGLFATTARRRT